MQYSQENICIAKCSPNNQKQFNIVYVNAFLEAVASLGLVVSLSQSVCQSVSLSAFSKIRKKVFKRRYKWIQKVIIVNYTKQFIHYAEVDPILS